jgi:hypothetical protein
MYIYIILGTVVWKTRRTNLTTSNIQKKLRYSYKRDLRSFCSKPGGLKRKICVGSNCTKMKLLPQYYNPSEGFNFKTSTKNSSHANVTTKRDKWLKDPKNENPKSKNTKLTMRNKKAVILNNNPRKTTKEQHQNIKKTKDNGNGVNHNKKKQYKRY